MLGPEIIAEVAARRDWRQAPPRDFAEGRKRHDLSCCSGPNVAERRDASIGRPG